MSVRVLVVMFDSVEPELVDLWAARGYLPHLQQAMAPGHVREIENYAGFGNGTFWASVHTGVDPSGHGAYYVRQPTPPDYALDLFTKAHFGVAPYWKALANDGCRVGIVDPPESPTAHLGEGVEVMDWMVHRRIDPPRSTPPELIDQWLDRFGDDPFEGNIDRAVRERLPLAEIFDLSERRIADKVEAVEGLLTRDDWDLFAVNFSDAHNLSHVAWHLHEDPQERPVPTVPDADDPILSCYRALDDALGQLMRHLSTDGQVIVVLGPGIETNVSAGPLLPDVLNAFQRHGPRSTQALIRRMLRAIVHSKLIPWSLRQRLSDRRARVRVRRRARAGWRYYTVPHNDNAGAIRFNLRHREPDGVVEPGPPYEALCDALAERLMRLRDASGEIPIVSEVVKVHQQFNGPALDRLPDLFVIWNRHADMRSVSSPEIGTIENRSGSARTGDHSNRGRVISNQPIAGAGDPLVPHQVTQILVDAVVPQSAVA